MSSIGALDTGGYALSRPKKAAVPLRNRKALLAANLGNALEWFDWTAYAIFSAVIASNFFVGNGALSGLLGALAVFAVGFLMRPIGGLVFGQITDRLGRRTGLALTIAVTGVGSLIIGILPTYHQIGITATILLVAARLLQGLGVGGEVAASNTYLAEIAPKGRRGFWSSSAYVSTTLGVFGATFLALFLKVWLSKDQLEAWGWRIPFLVGGLLAVYAIYLRRRLAETIPFTEASRKPPEHRTTFFAIVRSHPAAVLRIAGLTVGGTVAYYTWGIFAPTYAIEVKGQGETSAFLASLCAQLIFIAALPMLGRLSDRLGRKPLMTAFAVGMILMAFPLDALVQGEFWQLFVAMTLVLLALGCAASIQAALMAEQFPTAIRATGIGLPYSLAVAIFGGTAPYLQTWLDSHDLRLLFVGYLVGLCVVTLVTTLSLKETRNVDLASEAAK